MRSALLRPLIHCAVLFALLLFSSTACLGYGVTVSPHVVTVCTGTPQTWTATYDFPSDCTETPTYTWSVDGTVIPGATGSQLTYTFYTPTDPNNPHIVSCSVSAGPGK